MPEASVDKYYFLVPRKDEIRFSGQAGLMEAKAVAHSMNYAANDELGSRVLPLDGSHNSAS